jgi:hypothetical protein
MKNDETENDFLVDARTALQESARRLDDGTLTQLRSARERAVVESSRPAGRRWVWMGVTAVVAGGAVLTVSLWVNGTPEHPMGVPGVENIDDVDLLSGSEGVQFYQDLEFYRWLDNDQGAG